MQRLSGKKVLLVEDNYLAGAAMRMLLSGMGCHVVGPIADAAEANRLAQDSEVDIGILDINIIGGTSAPVAESLGRRNRPFFFVTGYASPKHLPETLQRVRRLNKPVDEQELAEALLDVCG